MTPDLNFLALTLMQSSPRLSGQRGLRSALANKVVSLGCEPEGAVNTVQLGSLDWQHVRCKDVSS